MILDSTAYAEYLRDCVEMIFDEENGYSCAPLPRHLEGWTEVEFEPHPPTHAYITYGRRPLE